MRKPLVAGNWKMNKTVKEALALVAEMLPGLEQVNFVERVLCPPFTSLFTISTLLSESGVGLGAQNFYWEPSGAFTGEVSLGMVKEFCEYVIIGHSERREYFGETDATVNLKVKAALAGDLVPIVCIGETLEQNKANQTAGVVIRQIREGLLEVPRDLVSKVVIAYEPIWAIGTGLASSAEGANEVVVDMIRPTLHAMFGEEVAQSIRVLYGGSVKPGNAAEYFTQPDIDGALVGGASLKASNFIPIVQIAAK
jgi:triosephosphate isomerase